MSRYRRRIIEIEIQRSKREREGRNRKLEVVVVVDFDDAPNARNFRRLFRSKQALYWLHLRPGRRYLTITACGEARADQKEVVSRLLAFAQDTIDRHTLRVRRGEFSGDIVAMYRVLSRKGASPRRTTGISDLRLEPSFSSVAL